MNKISYFLDPGRVEKRTASWFTMNVDPSVFYRHIREIEDTLSHISGDCITNDIGVSVQMRFSNKDDLLYVQRKHVEFL